VERYVDAAELADVLGVSVRTIRRFTADGMPSETWGLRIRRYLPSECARWAQSRSHATIPDSRDRARIAPGQRQPKEQLRA
jgi:hypothetical protein